MDNIYQIDLRKLCVNYMYEGRQNYDRSKKCFFIRIFFLGI